MKKLVELLSEDNLYNDLDLIFENKKLVRYEVDNDEYTIEVMNDLVDVLVKLKMVTFFDDVPNMRVNVPIQPIDETDELHIETFHYNLDNEDDWLHERGVDSPMKLVDFKRELGL